MENAPGILTRLEVGGVRVYGLFEFGFCDFLSCGIDHFGEDLEAGHGLRGLDLDCAGVDEQGVDARSECGFAGLRFGFFLGLGGTLVSAIAPILPEEELNVDVGPGVVEGLVFESGAEVRRVYEIRPGFRLFVGEVAELLEVVVLFEDRVLDDVDV